MELQIEQGEPFPIARMAGELGTMDADQLTEALHELVSGPEAKLAIELSALQSISSSGLSALVNLVTRARLGGGEVVLIAPTSFVTGVLNVTRLDKWFNVCQNLDEARQRLA